MTEHKTVAEYVESECARLEAVWRRAGDYRAVADCFDLCVLNHQPLPAWLAPVVRQAMSFTAPRLNAHGRAVAKTGTYATQWRRLDVKRKRHEAAARALRMRDSGELAGLLGKMRPSKADAYEWAANWLRQLGSNAAGDSERIRRDYGAIERAENAANSGRIKT